jgi:hypothetical protein
VTGRRIGPVLDASVISDEGGRGEHASFTGAFTGMAAFDTSGSAIAADFERFAYMPGGMMRSALCIYELATGTVEEVLVNRSPDRGAELDARRRGADRQW